MSARGGVYHVYVVSISGEEGCSSVWWNPHKACESVRVEMKDDAPALQEMIEAIFAKGFWVGGETDPDEGLGFMVERREILP